MVVSAEKVLKLCFRMFGAEKKTVIFGAGENGIRLLEIMKELGRSADFFCDNSQEKAGKSIQGVRCISYEELKQIENLMVFVSPSHAGSIYRQLERDGILGTVPEEIMELINFLPMKDICMQPIEHFYSLYPDFNVIRKNKERIFDREKTVLDIELNEEAQCGRLKKMSAFYPVLPKWKEMGEKDSEYRYRYGNPSLSPGDSIALFCMLQLIRPKRVIEVGSGFSSSIMLDVNEYYRNGEMELRFIEPYPGLLKSLCKSSDKILLRDSGLQEVEVEFFDSLESGDVLFIDSTHVSKVDSDVNYLLFEILPRLKKGVYIHFHDIFYPFEYPENWILESGHIWNECYLLRAFLQNNKEYSIEFFHNMMEQKHMEIFMENWPLEEKPHGGSLWLRKQ